MKSFNKDIAQRKVNTYMNIEHMTMARAFAGEYGLFLGLAWSLTFVIIVQGMSGMNILLMMLGFVMLISLIALPFYFAWRFRNHFEPEEQISRTTTWMFAIMMLFDACLVTGIAEYCYFQFIDGGRLMSTMRDIYSSPEITQQFKMMGAAKMQETAIQSIDTLAMLSPFELAFSMFTNNMFTALILSIPTAFIARRNKAKQ